MASAVTAVASANVDGAVVSYHLASATPAEPVEHGTTRKQSAVLEKRDSTTHKQSTVVEKRGSTTVIALRRESTL